eukprot:4446845-Pyramimonas_sp.AAC.1
MAVIRPRRLFCRKRVGGVEMRANRGCNKTRGVGLLGVMVCALAQMGRGRTRQPCCGGHVSHVVAWRDNDVAAHLAGPVVYGGH